MRQVEIHYHTEEDTFLHVANVTVGDLLTNEALEFAFSRTQNIEGSWSRGPRLDDPHDRKDADGEPITWQNLDYSPHTELLVPLPVHAGKTYGHRSSMVGDRFILDGKTYEVVGIGFREIAP